MFHAASMMYGALSTLWQLLSHWRSADNFLKEEEEGVEVGGVCIGVQMSTQFSVILTTGNF